MGRSANPINVDGLSNAVSPSPRQFGGLEATRVFLRQWAHIHRGSRAAESSFAALCGCCSGRSEIRLARLWPRNIHLDTQVSGCTLKFGVVSSS